MRVCALQTDGWLSEKSASIYEASTETLFLGRQDAMQRQSLVPLHSFMQGEGRQGQGRQGQGTKMLEVACGTGRFATFVKVRLMAVMRAAVLQILHFVVCMYSAKAVCVNNKSVGVHPWWRFCLFLGVCLGPVCACVTPWAVIQACFTYKRFATCIM